MINKVLASAAAAVRNIPHGASLGIGGFGETGVPEDLIDAVCDAELTQLHVISNNGGLGRPGGRGIGRLLTEGRVSLLTCSFPANLEFLDAYHRGEVEIELVPQGTLAERLRAGGAGIPAFYTPTGVGTLLGDGGFQSRFAGGHQEGILAPPKERRMFDGRAHLLEHALRPQFALVKAQRADRYGNARFRYGARNFNPVLAMAAEYTVLEVEQVESDAIPADDIHLPGIFVDAVVSR